MTRVKICGLKRLEDIEAVNVLGPDYIGFVFAKSRRQVSREEARALRTSLKKEIRAVGVFVNEAPQTIAALYAEGIIDLAQLHGQETEEDIRRLRALTACPLIQAVRVDGEADIERARERSADYLLFDNGAGGTGRSFSWELLRGKLQNGELGGKPVFIAGGLNPENVSRVIRELAPYGVDTSSGVETDGSKDYAKIKAFMAGVSQGKSYRA